MFESLERLRQKPDGEKKRFAFSVATLFSLVILAFWLFAIYPDFKKQNKIDKEARVAESGPTSSFISVFNESIKGMKDQFAKIIDYASSYSSNLEYYSASSTTTTTKNYNSNDVSTTTIEEKIP